MNPAPQTASSRDSVAPAAATLSLRAVTRSFAGRLVIGPIDLDLEPGAVCLVEGANGAGKTTLLRLAAHLLAPSSGRCRNAGLAVYVRPGAGARGEQSVGQALDWAYRTAARRGMPPDDALDLVGLTVPTASVVAALSAGQHTRLAMAIALVTGPALACVDEPTAHLDGPGCAGVVQAVAALAAAGSAVLVATPVPDTLDCPADAYLRLRHGLLEVPP
ncbi:MAG: ATP-binding cassette domain-containing protein [Actinophytocola sp.]|nr:ATP-binding cassette domain-containing protein [Actinophytocola sp.]